MTPREPPLRSRLMSTFKVEAEDHLRTITTLFLALDRGLPPGEVPAAVETAFRAVHTLKGAARSVGLAGVETTCRSLESLLSRIKAGEADLTRDALARLQEGADGIARLLAEAIPAEERAPGALAIVAPGAPPPSPPSGAAQGQAPGPPPPALGGTIRIETGRLDALQARAEELLGAKLSAQERAREAGELVEALARSAPEGGLRPASRSLELRARALLDRLLHDFRALSAAVEGLQDETRRIRMMPAASVLDAFPRMVSELV
ncbi:MAG TPA: Hpt domain-containing protein, partial [Vicinamibacteria bacterium]|nr:Hpt domain-containing protein [Vicinamibacteria bacterium]